MTLSDIADYIVSFVNSAVILLIGLSVVVIIFGILKFIAKASSDEERKKGQQRMIWGIIGIAVAVSTWGLVSLVINTF